MAVFDTETSILIENRHPYTGNVNSEMPGDRQNAFLHCGDAQDETRVGHHSLHFLFMFTQNTSPVKNEFVLSPCMP